MNNKTRPLCFAVVMELKESITYEHLQKGAQLAFRQFPSSNSIVSGKFFVEANREWSIDIVESEDYKLSVQNYLAPFIDLQKDRPIRQLYIKTKDGNFLVTRFHHALGDFVSFMQWIRVQFSHQVIKQEKLELKQFNGKRPVKSPYMYKNKAIVFGKHTGVKSPKRSWDTFTIDKLEINFKDQGFSYNDLLCATIFDSIREYNLAKGIKEHQNCLYIPMNLRVDSESGFGNGSGRIKVYDRFKSSDDTETKAKNIREQISTCREIGFWKMPTELGVFDKIPFFLSKILLNKIGMPLSEPGSLIFSNIDNLRTFEEVFSSISSIATISQMHSSYPMNLVANSYGEKTTITATWDANIISDLKMKMFLTTLKTRLVRDLKAIG